MLSEPVDGVTCQVCLLEAGIHTEHLGMMLGDVNIDYDACKSAPAPPVEGTIFIFSKELLISFTNFCELINHQSTN